MLLYLIFCFINSLEMYKVLDKCLNKAMDMPQNKAALKRVEIMNI